jgi:hypothetical protein
MGEKLLIAGGCSYTDKNFKTSAADFDMPEKTWPMWPEYLAKSLGLRDINVGRSGYDNFSIFNSVLESIVLNEGSVEAVVVLWSGWDRSLLFNSFNVVTINSFWSNIKNKDEWTNPQWMTESKFDQSIINFLNSDWWDPYSFLRDSVNSTFSLIYALSEICENRGIKYIFYQGVNPFEIHAINSIEEKIIRPGGRKCNLNISDILKQIKKCKYSGKLQERKDKILGWPFIKDLNGYCLDDLRYGRSSYFPDDPMDLSLLDKHPNQAAQNIISDIFYNKWKEVYG